MDKLYYGSGSCTINTSQIVGLQISYRGKINVDDKTGDLHTLMANDRMIIIFPLSGINVLSELFEYSGEFKITSVTASDADAKRVPVEIKRVMDYAELMDTNAEDLAIESERLNAGHTYKNKVKKTSVKQKTINNLHSDGELYLKGDLYSGAYHIHKDTGQAMTGAEHSADSKKLTIKQIRKIKPQKERKRKPTIRSQSGTSGGGY